MTAYQLLASSKPIAEDPEWTGLLDQYNWTLRRSTRQIDCHYVRFQGQPIIRSPAGVVPN